MAILLAIERYEVLKFLHVLLAILAVGFNASYAIWLGIVLAVEVIVIVFLMVTKPTL